MVTDLRNIIPDSMDHEKNSRDHSKSSEKASKQPKEQTIKLMQTLGEEIQKANKESKDVVYSSHFEHIATETDAPAVVYKQDIFTDVSARNTLDYGVADSGSGSVSANVDDDAVSLLLSSEDSDCNARGVDSFLRGKIEHEQHRLEIQQRAKKLLQVADEQDTRIGRWKDTLIVEEDEHDEEASLLNTVPTDKAWETGAEGCDILEDSEDVVEQTLIPPRRSREVEDSPRPRSCESGPAGEDGAEQAGGLAALKGTVAASLSMFRRDLLPIKMPLGNAGDDSPRWGGLLQAARRMPGGASGDNSPHRGGPIPAASAAGPASRAPPKDEPPPAPGPSRLEPCERDSGPADLGSKSGFALLRNSLAILKEDLGLGSR